MITVHVVNNYDRKRPLEIYDVVADAVCLFRVFEPGETVSVEVQENPQGKGEVKIRNTARVGRPRWLHYAWLKTDTEISHGINR